MIPEATLPNESISGRRKVDSNGLMEGELLKPGFRLSLLPAGTCEVVRFLGSGGQGEVYEATDGQRPIALKWYWPGATANEAQRQAIERLVLRGPPDPRFLWPEAIAQHETIRGFGYTMPLRPTRFRGLTELMLRKINPSFRSLAKAAYGLADSYLNLHSNGLAYGDISFGNAFLDPHSGEIQVCDNDNVRENNAKTQIGVLGTPKFMAPEIVVGAGRPNADTDRWSLAVLLFYLFVLHHPLEGKRESSIKCLDAPAMRKLYGSHPVFVFDPSDDSNRPDPRYHQNAILIWPVLPTFLQDQFVQTFTHGVRNSHKRVRESIWKEVAVRLQDSIVYGPDGAENFYDGRRLREEGVLRCWKTKQPIDLPPRIRLGKDELVMLNRDSKLYPHHIDPARKWDFRSPLAEVVEHPTIANRFGLRNLDDRAWTYTDGDTRATVEPGKSVAIADGRRILFGGVEGQIRW